MFCGLEERTRFRKKKKGKRKPHCDQKWIGWYEKIFFAVLKPFLNETAFCAKPSRRFSGLEIEVM